jgi:hypothetical protein
VISDQVHFRQGEHNEGLARTLAGDATFADWAIVAAFYAALHYIDAQLISNLGIDPERGPGPGHNVSVHKHRQDLVRQHYPRAFVPYRNLRLQSEQVRYLTGLSDVSTEYFGRPQAEDAVEQDLLKVKEETGIFI